MWTVEGSVTSIFHPDAWLYFMVTWNPDNTSTVGTAFFPTDPGTMSNNWWQRTVMWKRAAKLADGASFTAADGSEWIYPAGEDGRVHCYKAGTVYGQGTRKFRGELTTDSRDWWICDDPDWDWLPVSDGSQVHVGDTVRFMVGVSDTVASIEVVTNDVFQRSTFHAVDSDPMLGDLLGYWDQVDPKQQTWTPLNLWTFFHRVLKPSVDALFRAPDGSRWIYTGSSNYYCWGRGTAYSPGALFHRGEIAGGLTAIT